MLEKTHYQCENCTLQYDTSSCFGICEKEGCPNCFGSFEINDKDFIVPVHNNCFKQIGPLVETKVMDKSWFIK